MESSRVCDFYLLLNSKYLANLFSLIGKQECQKYFSGQEKETLLLHKFSVSLLAFQVSQNLRENLNLVKNNIWNQKRVLYKADMYILD